MMIDPDHGTGKIQYVLVTLLRECYDKFDNNIIHRFIYINNSFNTISFISNATNFDLIVHYMMTHSRLGRILYVSHIRSHSAYVRTHDQMLVVTTSVGL